MRAVVAIFAVIAAVGPVESQTAADIQGAWRTVQFESTGPNAATYATQPGFYLFTGNHYSITAVDAREPRPQFRSAAAPTPDEALAIWSPFTAQAGTFQVVDGNLQAVPLVAKNPHVMSAGRQPDTYRMILRGDTLRLTLIVSRLGPVDNPWTETLVRVR